MSWAQQVWHVMRKDARQLRWAYVVLTLLIAVVTIRTSLEPQSLAGSEGEFLLVTALAMLMVMLATQNDSATQATAFWASRPLDPCAMGSAKIGAALVITGLGVIGQSIALVANGIPLSSVPRLLIPSIGAFMMWMAVSVVVAVITSSVRQAILVFAIALIVAAIAVIWGNLLEAPWSITVAGMTVLILIVAIAMLIRVYATRRASILRSAAVAIIVVLSVLASFRDDSNATKRELPLQAGVQVTARASLASLPTGGVRVDIMLSGALPTMLVIAERIALNVTDGTGQVTRVETLRPYNKLDSNPTEVDGFHPRSNDDGSVRTITAELFVVDGKEQLLKNGVRSASVDATLLFYRNDEVFRVPLAQHIDTTRGDMRVEYPSRFLGTIPTGGGVSVRRPTTMISERGPLFLLANKLRNDATFVDATPMERQRSLVLPGTRIFEATYLLGKRARALTPEFLQDAELIVLDPQLVSTQHVSAIATIIR